MAALSTPTVPHDVSVLRPPSTPRRARLPRHGETETQALLSPVSVSVSCTNGSADLGLGIPFDIASYALLTHVTGTEAHEQLGDAHV